MHKAEKKRKELRVLFVYMYIFVKKRVFLFVCSSLTKKKKIPQQLIFPKCFPPISLESLNELTKRSPKPKKKLESLNELTQNEKPIGEKR